MFLTAPGAYVDSTMPQSCYSGMWPEETQYHNQYPTFYEWDDHSLYPGPTLTRPMDEHKYPSPHELLDFDHQPLSAIGKSVPYANELVRRDTSKPMKDWEPEEVIQWFCEEARNSNVDFENIQLPQFNHVNGCKLQNMTLEEFTQKDYHYGKFLYDAVRRYTSREATFLDDNLPPFNNLRPKDEVVYTDLSDSLGKPALSVIADDSYNDSDASSHEPFETKPPVIAPKLPGPPGGRRPVGRPPKPTRTKRGNKEKKCGRLWEFIRDLLLKPEYCPSLICWENHEEGIFRFVRSDKVAELWGTIKENPKMTYEKLSRAMRYYYKSQVLQPVLGRRLVYKFGPTARGWRTNNPNFRDSTK